MVSSVNPPVNPPGEWYSRSGGVAMTGWPSGVGVAAGGPRVHRRARGGHDHRPPAGDPLCKGPRTGAAGGDGGAAGEEAHLPRHHRPGRRQRRRQHQRESDTLVCRV
eukprot:1195614-Prorocentrum_minimum.AAC.3